MNFTLDGNTVVITREPGDPGLSRGGYAGGWAPEHRVLYWVKKWVEKTHGVKMVKTTVDADYLAGIMHHLTDGDLPYLRLPKKLLNKGGAWDVLVVNLNSWCRGVDTDCKDDRKVVLNIVRNHNVEET